MVNAQEWLDREYPLETRNNITELDISEKNLTDSLKLVRFNNLTRLNCSDNQLMELNVNGCSALTELHCSGNQLMELNVNGCSVLTELWCSDNQLMELKINSCLVLTELHCSSNQLTELEINDCLALTELWCSDNQLIKLDVSGCSVLTKLDCSDNQLMELNVNGCSALTELWCSDNQLTGDLTIFSQLLDCEKLILDNNFLVGNLVSLQKLNKLKELWIANTNLTTGLEYLPESLEKFYCNNTELIKKLEKLSKFSEDNYIFLSKNWKKWINQEFTNQQVYRWINAGAKIDDHEFIAWLRDVKNYNTKWIANYKADYELLSNRFKKYGLCSECKYPNTGEQWCKDCNNPHLQQDFAKWTSHNPKINEFIQKYQLQATDADKFLEWIPYEQFVDIEYLAEGGFGKVYKAKWTTGNIHHWDQESRHWQREKDIDKDYKEIVLKILNSSQNNADFLQETANHKIIDDWFNNIVPCYGISQDPTTGNYLMVMKYMPEGNLRQYLSKNNKELIQLLTVLKEKLIRERELDQEIKILKGKPEFKEKEQELTKLRSEITDLKSRLGLLDKFSQLVNISRGLKDIHQKNLVHHDFHSGNILKGIGRTACLITDLGLCRPAEETGQEKIYGVLPYVAPEVLLGNPYTKASDIYSFAIIAYEILSGLPPYCDRIHDANLGVEICHGLRPQFQIKIPSLLEKLINRCWDANPQNRPIAHDLERNLRIWQEEINSYRNTEFKKQLQEAEAHNETLPDEIKFPNYKVHQGAVYHSKLLPTKEITQLMQNLNFQTKALELNTQLIKAKELAQEITVQQKYNDFKKVLKLVLEKSEELEKIIATDQLVISEEMKEVLTKIKELKHKSQEKDSAYQEFAKKKLAKENELKELKKVVIVENDLEEDELEDILEAQAEFIKTNDSKRLERTKKRLIKTISETEINQLCQLQTEITQLELRLNQNIDQSTRQLTRIINNINNVQVGNINFTNTQVGNSVVIGVGQIDETNFNLNQNKNWTNIHQNFTPSLINRWKTNNFTYEQTQEWINIGLTVTDSDFCAWLRDTKHLTAEECLNYHNFNQLKSEYQAQLLQAQIQIPPKN